MTDTAIRTLEYEADIRDQELADLRLRVARLESAAGFVVRRGDLATSKSLRERIEALRRVLYDDPSPLKDYDLRYITRELIDAIAMPKARDFRHAWDEACLFFGRFGDEPTLVVPLLRLAEATRLYVADDDEDRVETWNAMVMALDKALQSCAPDGSWSHQVGPELCAGCPYNDPAERPRIGTVSEAEADARAHLAYAAGISVGESHAPECDSFDFDPEKQLGPDKPCNCPRNATGSVASCACRVLLNIARDALADIASGEAGDEQAHDWHEFYESIKRGARSVLEEIETKETCS